MNCFPRSIVVWSTSWQLFARRSRLEASTRSASSSAGSNCGTAPGDLSLHTLVAVSATSESIVTAFWKAARHAGIGKEGLGTAQKRKGEIEPREIGPIPPSKPASLLSASLKAALSGSNLVAAGFGPPDKAPAA